MNIPPENMIFVGQAIIELVSSSNKPPSLIVGLCPRDTTVVPGIMNRAAYISVPIGMSEEIICAYKQKGYGAAIVGQTVFHESMGIKLWFL